MSVLVERGALRVWWVALRALVLTTVVVIAYTLVVTAVGLALPAQAHGSLVRVDGRVVGSRLIGQSFTTAKGAAIARWFQSRPSAAGAGYDGRSSSASNLGPNSADLLSAIRERQAAIRSADGASGSIPPDAVTASGSGLDPDISPAYALLQVDRVAAARGLPAARVRALVERSVTPPPLGFLGRPTVNVLELDLALAKMDSDH